MLDYSDIKERTYIVWDGAPHEVLSSHIFRKQQRKPVNQTKLRNLITGSVTERSFHQSEKVEEAEIELRDMVYIYKRRGEYWFSYKNDPRNRFSLPASMIGEQMKFIKPNSVVEGLHFKDSVIGIRVPIKVELEVTDAPPAVKGNTAQGGTKQVTLESGAVASVPLFINEGDVVRINTETGEYTERVEKK